MHHTEGLVIDNCHNVIIVAMTLTQELRMSRKTIKHLHAAKDSLGQDSDPILSPGKEIQSVTMHRWTLMDFYLEFHNLRL